MLKNGSLESKEITQDIIIPNSDLLGLLMSILNDRKYIREQNKKHKQKKTMLPFLGL